MAFKIGDKVEVYRYKYNSKFSKVVKGLKGIIKYIDHTYMYGAFAYVELDNFFCTQLNSPI